MHSVVGRFLEHARVFYFENGDQESDLFLSSADLMPRNLRNRIEQCTPIKDLQIKQRIRTNLGLYLKDNSDAWLMLGNGDYKKIVNHDEDCSTFNVQQAFLTEYSDEF